MRVDRFVPVVVIAAALLAFTSVGLAAAPTVKLATVSVPALSSTILVDGSKRPLYHFTTEHGKAIRCTGTCAKTWPPVLVAKGARVVAGPGVNRSKLGSIVRPDGRFQVTYAGLALYRYASDRGSSPRGQGFGKVWYVISPAGKLVTRVADDSATQDAGQPGGTDGGTTTDGPATGGGGYDDGYDDRGGYTP